MELQILKVESPRDSFFTLGDETQIAKIVNEFCDILMIYLRKVVASAKNHQLRMLMMWQFSLLPLPNTATELGCGGWHRIRTSSVRSPAESATIITMEVVVSQHCLTLFKSV